jgi:hypothetical protein
MFGVDSNKVSAEKTIAQWLQGVCSNNRIRRPPGVDVLNKTTSPGLSDIFLKTDSCEKKTGKMTARKCGMLWTPKKE